MTNFDFLFEGYHAFPMNHVWWPSVGFLLGRGGRDSFLLAVFVGVLWERALWPLGVYGRSPLPPISLFISL